MAYIIPSKNIFDVKHNKLIDNKISAVDISEKVYSEKEIEISKTFDIFEKTGETKIIQGEESADVSIFKCNYDVGSNISFPIANISEEITEFIIPNSISVGFEFSIRNIFLMFQRTYETHNVYCVENNVETIKTEFLGVQNINNYRDYFYDVRDPSNLANSIRFSTTNKYVFDGDASSFVPQKGNKIKIPSIEGLKYGYENTNGGIFTDSDFRPFHIAYIVERIKIIIRAKTIYEKDASSRVIGNVEEGKTLRLEKNEFPASYGIIPSNQTAMEEVANKIISNYKNGRETATVVCGVSFRYKKIPNITHLNTRIFKNGDVVCPMVSAISGLAPLSVSTDRQAKNFIVANNKVTFDGEILQELSLIEDVNSTTDFKENITEFTEISLAVEEVYYTGIFVEGEKYVFDADTGLNKPFIAKRISVYTKYTEEYVGSFLAPNVDKIITRSGNIGFVAIKNTVYDKYDNHYGWYVVWEKEPTKTPIFIDKLIYTL